MTSHIHCQNCSMAPLCLPYLLDPQQIEQLDSIIQRHRPLQKRDLVFHSGDSSKFLYAVRSGSLKSYTLDSQGGEQIIDFHLPGDLIGFDGLIDGHYRSYTQALETTMLCEIPIQSLDQLSAELPGLRKQLLRVVSSELYSSKELMGNLNHHSAQQRLAHFFVMLSSRFQRRGLSSREFRLSMTRADIGNYLGLSVETISRLLTQLQRDGLLRVQNKLVAIHAPERLRALAS